MNPALLKVSDIHCPEAHLPNPEGKAVEKANKEFAFSIGLFNLISEKNFYAASSIGKFAYPYATFDKLVVCCQLVEWLFFIDDQFDENENLVFDKVGIVTLVEEYISLFRTGIANVMDSPIVKLSQSLRKKLLKFGTPEWFERICISTEEYLRIGVLGAVDVWRNKNPCTIDNYMLNREYDSGVYTCIDMVEIVADINLSAEVRNDRRVQKLRKLTARHVAFTNDLYSYNKEVPKHANPNNLVYLLMHWKKLSFDESVSEIVKIINSDMESFLQLKKEVLSDERCTSVSLQKYIAGMEHWMSGNIDWSIQTSRYKVNAPAILV